MTDYIDREAAKECVIHQYCASSDETENALGEAIEEIQALSSADVKPVIRARWIKECKVRPDIDGDGDYQYRCSNCSHSDIHNENVEVPFCWYCGADMREVEK